MHGQYHSPSCMCCCSRNEYNYNASNKYALSRASSEDDSDCSKYGAARQIHSSRNNRSNGNQVLNHQFRNPSCCERQRAFQYSRSDMEAPSAVKSCVHGSSRGSDSRYDNASLLRRANDLIDYPPESRFLKKMKQQCQLLHSHQPNIFYNLNEFFENDNPSYECQKCSDSSAPVSRQGGQISNDRNKCAEKLRKCSCSQATNAADAFNDATFFKNFADIQRQCRENKGQEESEKNRVMESSGKKCKKQKKKSEHISRSKKPEKCRGMRKRKSNSSEKCDLEDEFEPSLKKPHENSCERCWRFASPARSPVNKPDQKFDPNFRRGHSNMDLGNEGGDSVEKESSCDNVRPGILKEKGRSLSLNLCGHGSQFSPASRSQVPKGKYSTAQSSECEPLKLTELLACSTARKPLEKYLPESQEKDSQPKPKSVPEECQRNEYSDSGRYARPKTCSLGFSRAEMGKCSKPANDLNVTDYKTICTNQKKQCFDTFEPANRAKPLESFMPTSFRDFCVPKGCSPSGPCDHYNLKSISEHSKEKCDDLKSNLTKTSKNFSSLEVKSQKAGESSFDRGGKLSSLPRKEVSESSKSGASKLKGNQEATLDKSKNTKEQKSEEKPEKKSEKKPVKAETKTEKSSDKKTGKKTEKKPQKKTPQPSKLPTGSNRDRDRDKDRDRDRDRSRSSKDNRSKICGGDREKSQSAGDSVTKEFHFNAAPNCGNTFEHSRTSHAIRDCTCYPRLPTSKNNPNNQGHVFCCHCDWGENQKNQSYNANSCKTSVPARPVCRENERFYPESNPESIDRRRMNTPDFSSRECGHTHRSTIPESNYIQSSRGADTLLSCPYRKYSNGRAPLISTIPDSARCPAYENERLTPRDYRYVPGNQNTYPECSPRKYFMFYMTKCNEKQKGNDVEVLVEELAQGCPSGKDTRTKDIAEKMKKIMECPSDSLALRFQKGVSEKYITPPSSRVLYF